jgi:hypothetical protein
VAAQPQMRAALPRPKRIVDGTGNAMSLLLATYSGRAPLSVLDLPLAPPEQKEHLSELVAYCLPAVAEYDGAELVIEAGLYGGRVFTNVEMIGVPVPLEPLGF